MTKNTAETPRDSRGWRTGPYGIVERQTKNQQVDVDIDEHDLNVRIDEGHGYTARTCSTSIPLPSVIGLLRSLGYRVQDPPCPNYEARVECYCNECCARRYDDAGVYT